MTTRKKPLITSGSDEIKHYAVSTGELASSPSETSARSKANPGPDSNQLRLDSDGHNISQITEQRKARRFPVSSPATIRWLGSDGGIHEAFGMVRDISTCGLFVEAALPLRINSNVELEIVPFGMQAENPKTELHFEGKIVRSEHSTRHGFAVAGFLWLSRLGMRIS